MHRVTPAVQTGACLLAFLFMGTLEAHHRSVKSLSLGKLNNEG